MSTDRLVWRYFGHDVVALVERAGQEPADRGDKIRVRLRISIPADVNSHEIVPELRFGDRVRLLDQPLGPFWGLYENGERCQYRHFYSHKWLEAFKQASDCAWDEISDKLGRAVTAREEALRSAEILDEY